jgi:hypothetical protein
MQEYNMKPDGFKEIRKQILIRTIPIMVVAITVGLLIGSLNSSDKYADINTLPILIPIILLLVGIGLYRGINRQKTLFESYKITIAENLVKREQLNTPIISIYFNDIQEIIQKSNGNFIVKGPEPKNVIIIPAQVNNYSELYNALNQIRPIITKPSNSLFQKYQFLFVLLTLTLMVLVYTVSNKIVVATSGSFVILILMWSLIIIHTNKNIDIKTKKSSWWALVIVASVIYIMYNKLTA